VEQFKVYLDRRKEKASVRKCVETTLLTIANDVEATAQRWDGPFETLWRHRFKCQDGTTTLYIEAELSVTDDTVAVLGCGTKGL